MPLSDHEQRLLDQIEQALYAEDPKFASAVRSARNALPRAPIAGARASLGVIAGLGARARRALAEHHRAQRGRVRARRRSVRAGPCSPSAPSPRPAIENAAPAQVVASRRGCVGAWKTASARRFDEN